MRFVGGLPFLIALVLAVMTASPACAGQEVERAPVPAWVKPVSPPIARPAEGTNVTGLMLDEQVDIKPGEISSYTGSLVRIDSAEGLSAGNISLPWEPDTQRLIVHRLEIHRGDRTIDILGSGQHFTIIRRESNLESATLDGQLTANIQPEGLQVGDVIDLAMTIVTRDTSLGDHVERLMATFDDSKVYRRHMSVQWPADLPIRLRPTRGFPPVRPQRLGALMRIEASADDFKPVIVPTKAPLRYQRSGLLEISDYRDWSQLGAMFAPLYDKAATIPADSALQAEVERIRGASTDPKARAEAALALVQGQVRYVALLMGSGGFVPADATTTWSRRYGDCKAKSALLLALLRPLGISAEPVIVNTDYGDGMDERLPMVGLFNHVIVRASIGGRTYWLDGTRTGDRRLDQLETPDYDWGLPLTRTTALVRMQPGMPQKPLTESSVRIDARAGISLPASVHAEAVYRGDAAYFSSVSAANYNPQEREKGLRGFWKRHLDWAQIDKVSYAYDPVTREESFVMDGKADLDWRDDVYWLSEIGLGYAKTSFERGPGEDPDAPFLVTFPYFDKSSETILLPPGIEPDPADAELVAGGVEYRRKASFTNGTLAVETTTRSLAPEFPAREGPEAQRAIRALAARYVGLRVTQAYAQTDAEIDRDLAMVPKSSADFMKRGALLYDRQDVEGAFAAYDQAIRLGPPSAKALAARAIIQTKRKHYDAAAADVAAAMKLDPDDFPALQARAWLAQAQGHCAQAIEDFSTLLKAFPDDVDSLRGRTDCFVTTGDTARTLADTAHAQSIAPGQLWIYDARVPLLYDLGRRQDLWADLAMLTRLRPDDAEAMLFAARYYAISGKQAEALAAFDRTIALKPSTDALIERSGVRRWADMKASLADIDQALKIEPANTDVLRAKAELQMRQRDFAGAASTLSAAIKLKSKDGDLLAARGRAEQLDGRKSDAQRDFALASKLATTAADYNRLCWMMAIADADLGTALSYCDTAMKTVTEDNRAMALDSRGFVLVKLGRLDEAISAYDSALGKRPDLSESLFGRGIALARKGDRTRAEADRKAAIALDPDVADKFGSYGLSF